MKLITTFEGRMLLALGTFVFGVFVTTGILIYTFNFLLFLLVPPG